MLKWIPFSNKLERLAFFIQQKANSREARIGLYFFSALESIIIPIPTDPLMATCVYAAPKRWWQIAFLTAGFSVLGGLIGWGIGWFFGDFISFLLKNNMIPFLSSEKFNDVTDAFSKHGLLIVLLGAFTPLPFKIVTVTAGLFKFGFFQFLVAALIGRTVRFLLVAGLVKYHNSPKFLIFFSCSIGLLISLSYIIIGY